MESIEQMVYEIDIPVSRLKEIEDKYIISNIRNVKDGLAVKIVTDVPSA